MKFKSSSTVKYLLVLCLAIASSSGYWYTRLAAENRVIRDGFAQLDLDQQKAQNASVFLAAELTNDMGEVPLDKALAGTMLTLYNKRTEYRVDIAQAKAAQGSGNSLAAEIGQFAEQVPGTQLKSVKVSLTGSYADYEGFMGYLAHLREQHPVSLVYLKVNDLSFEMNIRVFGK